MKSDDLIAYAMDLASYLIQNIEEKNDIKSIILFGSAARGDYGKNSDVDIFIDTNNKEIEKISWKIVSDFYKSVKFTKYWKLLGIKNEISLKVGELDKWELKDSVISDGITLYGKYVSKTKTMPFTLFELKIKGKRKDKIRIWRKLYGYKQKVNNKTYESISLIKELNGRKFGKATFIVPVEHTQKIIKYLKENKVNYFIYRIWCENT